MLQAGQPAPAFSLPDADMDDVELRALLGHNVVLYFYPKDDTPGCTLEAIEFSDLDDQFRKCDCLVLGVSRDDCFTHADFRDKHGLAVRLLSDPDVEVCRAYGAWQQREIDGHKRMGLVRSTIIIDRNGIVRHALYGVSPRGHAAQVLELVRQLDGKEAVHAHDRKKHRRHAELSRAGSGREHD